MFGKFLRIYFAVRLFKRLRARNRRRVWRGRGGWGDYYYDPLHGRGLAGLFARRRRSLI